MNDLVSRFRRKQSLANDLISKSNPMQHFQPAVSLGTLSCPYFHTIYFPDSFWSFISLSDSLWIGWVGERNSLSKSSVVFSSTHTISTREHTYSSRLCPCQQLSTGSDLLPRGHLAKLEIFLVVKPGTGIYWVRYAVKHPTIPRMISRTKNYLAPNVNSATVQKPWSLQMTLIQLFLHLLIFETCCAQDTRWRVGGRHMGTVNARIKLRCAMPWEEEFLSGGNKPCLILNQTDVQTAFGISPHSHIPNQTLYHVPFYPPSSPPNSFDLLYPLSFLS